MIRISRSELIERWAMTYGQNGFDVRAENVKGLSPPDDVFGVVPDIEATKLGETVLAKVIDAQDDLTQPEAERELKALHAARSDTTALHLIVALECLLEVRSKIDDWGVVPDAVHIT